MIRSQPGTPVVIVILTSSAEEADIAAAYRLGANGFLVKPNEASKLDDLVKAIHAFWLTHNALPSESFEERSVQPTWAKYSARAIVGQPNEWQPLVAKPPLPPVSPRERNNTQHR
jgi:DNA-binding NarL/FixJ family response regulator